MERLWAPWRMTYILQTVKEESDQGCVFCKMLAEHEDAKNLILLRGERVFLVMNLFPYNTGHLMAIPYRHTGDFGSLSVEEHSELGQTVNLAKDALTECLSPHGFNIGMNIGRAAGAGILDHLHYHIVPRWSGDSNFMSAVAETKILSEALPDTYARLRQAIELLRAK